MGIRSGPRNEPGPVVMAGHRPDLRAEGRANEPIESSGRDRKRANEPIEPPIIPSWRRNSPQGRTNR
jgi:hypothetical protein